MCQLKAKDSESFNYLVFLENTSVEISVGDLKETVLYEYVYNFSVTSWSIDVVNTLAIHPYLMNKNNMK